MTDREMLELAAKAAGYGVEWDAGESCFWGYYPDEIRDVDCPWNPLNDDGDALRLAVKLKLAIRPLDKCVFVESDPETLLGQSQFSELEMYGSDAYAATRRAIVRAAAAIGQSMS